MDGKGSRSKNLRRAGAGVPQPRLASKERTRTWGTRPPRSRIRSSRGSADEGGVLITNSGGNATPYPDVTAQSVGDACATGYRSQTSAHKH